MLRLNNLSFIKRIIFATVSGAMIIPFSYLESFGEYSILGASIIDIAIGFGFALMVMTPFQKRFNWIRTLLMILASIVIYVGVAKLAISHYHVLFLKLSIETGIIVSGGLGALLTGLSVQLLASIKLTINSYLVLLILGLISGYVFSITIDSENIFINAIGFIVWQVAVTGSLFLTKK